MRKPLPGDDEKFVHGVLDRCNFFGITRMRSATYFWKYVCCIYLRDLKEGPKHSQTDPAALGKQLLEEFQVAFSGGGRSKGHGHQHAIYPPPP